MRITSDVVRFEFIGRHAEVAKITHSSDISVSGTVVDETRNTFTVLARGKRKAVIKESAIFRFELPDHSMVEIDGRLLVGRPEDRLKRCIKRLW
jgi:ribonuclease P protein subunit POP4